MAQQKRAPAAPTGTNRSVKKRKIQPVVVRGERHMSMCRARNAYRKAHSGDAPATESFRGWVRKWNLKGFTLAYKIQKLRTSA
jgi:hypothetical protein